MNSDHPKFDPGFHFRNAGLESKYQKQIEFAQKTFTEEAILLKCVECSGLDYKEAINCSITTCPLFGLNKKLLIDNPKLRPKGEKK